MNGRPFLRSSARWCAAAVGVATVGCHVRRSYLVAVQKAGTSRPDERDELLDRFIPAFDVVERHHVSVMAPAAVTFAATRTMDVSSNPSGSRDLRRAG